MKIGIDCRIYGTKNTGIGRYVQNLVEELLTQDKENEYVLFVRKDFQVQSASWRTKFKIIEVDIPHYSLKEQLFFPSLIVKEKVDLMHFTHFNVPVFYQEKYVVTIHDLIKHISKGTGTTTRSPWLYWLKYLGYKFVFEKAVKRAEKIIVPSQFVKDEVVREYRVEPRKVVVTYEGVGSSIKYQVLSIKQKEKILEKYNIKKPYLLYVGSVYPHKNIEKLIEVLKILNNGLLTSHLSLITLVIVCARNVFSGRVSSKITQMKAEEYVKMAGFVPDEELAVLYKEAEAFVFPTLSEGFGLPGLEAMSVGCPVICSEIPVLKEVYGDAAAYFNPHNPSDIALEINGLLTDEKKRKILIEAGLKMVAKYSWSKMAGETEKIYESIFASDENR